MNIRDNVKNASNSGDRRAVMLDRFLRQLVHLTDDGYGLRVRVPATGPVLERAAAGIGQRRAQVALE